MERLSVISAIYFLLIININNGYIIEPGPRVKATKGGVWPKPQEQNTSIEYYIVRPQAFEFKVVGEDCDLLQSTFQRYHGIINGTLNAAHDRHYQPARNDKNFIDYLNTLNVSLKEPCKNISLPTESMKENYTLNINNNGRNELSADSIWGIIRGLETFSQLLFATKEGDLQINRTNIIDFPRFSHRGLLIDTSRHYEPLSELLKMLDAMNYNKMNVFHWHITDDESFPYVSLKYPELSEQGAFTNSQVYSRSDVQTLIRYAAARGIRVMVEFDTPGHTRSWGIAHPELLTPCYKDDVPAGTFGPMDPTQSFTYTFLRDFFSEVVKVFPEHFVHLGGDETGYECWKSNPNITRFMKEHNFTKYNQLEEYYIQRLVNITDDLKAKSVVWEEVFVNGVKLPPSTIVHVWKPNWKKTMRAVTKAGYNVLLSSCWYLDHLKTGGDWVKYYDCEPNRFKGSQQQQSLLLGGEACMWSEVVNEYNIESRVWPRASATAEKLWSAEDADTSSNAAKRLEEHTCRMNRRGIGAQPPTGAGFCS